MLDFGCWQNLNLVRFQLVQPTSNIQNPTSIYTGSLKFFSTCRDWALALALATSLAAYTAAITPDRRAALDALAKLKPAAALLAYSAPGRPREAQRLEELDQRVTVPVIRVHNSDFYKLADAAKPGPMDLKLSLHLPPPVEKPVNLRNVVG